MRDYFRNRQVLGSIRQLDVVVPVFTNEYIPTANTKLLLHFNDNVTDYSGNSKNGSASGITYVSSPNSIFGKSINFAGSGSVDIGKYSTTYLYNNWTMVAWVKRNVTGTNNNIIYQMGNCFFRPTECGYYDGSGDRYVINSDFDSNDTSNYHLYVWTKSSTDGQKFYQDGVLSGSQAATSDNSDNYPNVGLGYQRSPVSNQSCNQKIDEFILESGIWSASEILAYFNKNKSAFGL